MKKMTAKEIIERLNNGERVETSTLTKQMIARVKRQCDDVTEVDGYLTKPETAEPETAEPETAEQETAEQETKREKKVKERNKKKVEETREEIERQAKEDNIVNTLAREIGRKWLYGIDYTKDAMTLANIIAQSRLNTLIKKDKTYRNEFLTMKNNIYFASKYDDCLDALNDLYDVQVITKKNNDFVTAVVCKDKDRETAILEKLRDLNKGDGVELVSVALLSIIEHLDKYGSLLEPFEVYEKKSMVYKNGDLKPENLWTKTTTNGIKETYTNVSKEIRANASIKESTTLWNKVELTATTEDGEEIEVERYTRQSVLSAYTITDFNGRAVADVANDHDDKFFRIIPKKCKFTRQECYVYEHLYMNGESRTQVADSLHVSLQRVDNITRQIKAKVIEGNVFANFTQEDAKQTNQSKEIDCYIIDGDNKTYLHTFDSVNLASRTLDVERGNIIKVLKGKRKQTKGYYFEYVK